MQLHLELRCFYCCYRSALAVVVKLLYSIFVYDVVIKYVGGRYS